MTRKDYVLRAPQSATDSMKKSPWMSALIRRLVDFSLKNFNVFMAHIIYILTFFPVDVRHSQHLYDAATFGQKKTTEDARQCSLMGVPMAIGKGSFDLIYQNR